MMPETRLDVRVTARIEQLKKERDNFLAQANQQLAAYNASIGELEKLLAPEPQDDGGETPQATD